MPRLLGVEIPADKRVEVSLTYIYGIGFSTARRILEQTNIDANIRAKDLTPQQLNEIIHAITNNKIKIEGDLRRDVQGNLKRLLTWLKKRIPQIRTKRKRKAKLVKSNRPPKRQLQKPKQRLNVQRKRKRQSQRRNSQHLQPERPKVFLSQPKRLTSRRSSKPKGARTFIQVLRMCSLLSTTRP